ncbi:MAG: dipeptide epimerase [Fibrobacterota bacterium]|nr:dipeptide epimerase [Fibrobacterota bacterium]
MSPDSISQIEIFKLALPMEPFLIATQVSTVAQNTFIRIHTAKGLVGMGECSAFPMLVGETQATCFEVARDFAHALKGKDPLDIQARMDELHARIAFNMTIKSAFDMALHDLAAKTAGLPLYRFLGGEKKDIETDFTIGIGAPAKMADTAKAVVAKGAGTLKIKLGKGGNGETGGHRGDEDMERVRLIRETVGPAIALRLDANQGWDFETAAKVLQSLARYDIQFCEQPIHHDYDYLLPDLRKLSPVKIMADESVFNHHDAIRLIRSGAIDSINVKLAKSGGILEALRIAETAREQGIPCMLGGMLESRLALTAKVHLAMSHGNFKFYDLDTCLLGQLEDPVIGGARYCGYHLEVGEEPGIAADIDPAFLTKCESTVI